MKKTTIYIVMALLCLNFWVMAQDNKAVDVTLKGIQIGQKVPDFTITNLHSYKDASGKPATTTKLSDFKGKLLILDFWATWCSPCIGMIPKMDSLQRAFGDKIQFLSVTYQTEIEVLPFLDKIERDGRGSSLLPVATSDNTLRKLFPHRTLPHYVWIGSDGKLENITGLEAISVEKINGYLQNTQGRLDQKIERVVSYNRDSLLLNQNVPGYLESMEGFSSFNRYIDGLPSRFTTTLDVNKGFKASYINVSILHLLKFAHHDLGPFDNKRIIYEVADKDKVATGLTGSLARTWWKDNTYCYELYMPVSSGNTRTQFYQAMRQDMKRFLPKYSVGIEKRVMKAWALMRTGSQQLFATTANMGTLGKKQVDNNGYECTNLTLSHFVYALSDYYLQGLELPVVDGTGYEGKVDLKLVADMRDIASINRALERYGLKFMVRDIPMDILVIKDSVL